MQAINNNRMIDRKTKRSRSNHPKRTLKTDPSCGVCGQIGGNKYKCPRCRFPYCSVKCCREHKEKCPAIQMPDSQICDVGKISCQPCHGIKEPSTNKEVPRKSNYLSAELLTRDPLENRIRRRDMLEDDDHEEGWRINRDMMDKVDNSSWLRNELSDGGLRQIIAEIDAADDGVEQRKHKKRPKLGVTEPTPCEIALLRAKLKNKKFEHFIDKLLVIAGVLSEDVQPLNDITQLLIEKDDDNLGTLTLAPIIKKRRNDEDLCDSEVAANSSQDEESNTSNSNASLEDF